MSKEKIWTKEFISLLFSNFFVSLVFYLLMTSLAVYTIQYFHANESEAGLAASIFIIGALVARLLTGKAISYIKRKTFLLISFFIFILAMASYLFSDSLLFLYVVRFIHGCGFGAISTGISTTIMSNLPIHKKGEGTGYFSLSSTLATGIGPFLAIFLNQHYDYEVIFILCTVLSIIAVVPIILLKLEDELLLKGNPFKNFFSLDNFFEKKIIHIAALMILGGICYSAIVTFINSYAIELGLEKAASYYFLIYGFVLFFSRPIVGKLFDQKGENIVLYPSYILFAAAFILLGIATNAFTLLLSSILLAVGYGSITSSIQTLCVQLVDKTQIGLAVSTFFICMDFGFGFGPFLLGFVIPYLKYRGLFIVLAVISLVILLIYHFIHGKKVFKNKRTVTRGA